MIKQEVEWIGAKGVLEYYDCDDFNSLPNLEVKQVYGACFYDEKLVIGQRKKNKNWGLIGGSVEDRETLLETLHREILEESNMRILKATPIGYQIVKFPDKVDFIQVRYACLVEPNGEFVSDPDGGEEKGIIAIRLINPGDYKEYFDWGAIGDRIIERALEIKKINF